MAETFVELVEEWQTGAFFVVACVLVAAVFGTIVGTNSGPLFGVTVFLVTGIGAFAILSYLLYGR